MSDKPKKSSAKEDIKRFQDLKGQSITSASNPPPLPPSRTGTKPPSHYPSLSSPESSQSDMACSKCGDTKGECSHFYEEIASVHQRSEVNHYEPLITSPETSGSDLNSRLRKIEDNQTRIRTEFNDFRDVVSKDMKSLSASIKHLIETCDSLDESMRDSFGFVNLMMEKNHTKLLEGSDHLGKQIIDVRRDIQELASHQQHTLRSTESCSVRKKQEHSFEWEVGSLDSMVKHQKSSSSQSYMIGQVDFKILGGVACSRDGRLCVRVYGDFTHMPLNPWDRKNGEFESAVFLVDKTGKQPDLLVGRVAGDFNKDKEWAVGEVPACDVKLKGYAARGGNVNLKFVIEVLE